MKQLVLLYWGCVFLMYLSEVYHPVDVQIEGEQTGKYHFLRRRSDIFMVIVIAWLTCFSFLRTSYNDTANYIHFFCPCHSKENDYYFHRLLYLHELELGRPLQQRKLYQEVLPVLH